VHSIHEAVSTDDDDVGEASTAMSPTEIEHAELPPSHGKSHYMPAQVSRVCRMRWSVLLALTGFVMIVLCLAVGVLNSLEINSLKETVQDQIIVIDRFTDSVTNADVVMKMNALETTLKETEEKLSAQVSQTETEIYFKLDQTVEQLDESVENAKTTIEQEVVNVLNQVDSYVRTTNDQFSVENDFMIYQIAGTFTLIGCLVAMWHMTAHLRKMRQPFVQRKILAILWMSPIYSITSWLSLIFTEVEGYLTIVKDFYEAYVIYQFLSFLIAVLGRGNRQAVVDILSQRPSKLTKPGWMFGRMYGKTYDTPENLADAVLLQCQVYAMQFVFLRPMTSICSFAFDQSKHYASGSSYDYKMPQFYIMLIQNLSVFTAVTGLVKFYNATYQDLKWCRPWPKFMAVKGIVFMTFWQGLVISILANVANVVEDDTEKWARQAQDFLICLEMLLFSIAHIYVFPTEEWEEGYRPVTVDTKFGDNIALRDFVQDLRLIISAQVSTHTPGNGAIKLGGLSRDDGLYIDTENREAVSPAAIGEEGAVVSPTSLFPPPRPGMISGTPQNLELATTRLLNLLREAPVHLSAAGTSVFAAEGEDDDLESAESFGERHNRFVSEESRSTDSDVQNHDLRLTPEPKTEPTIEIV